MAEFTGKVIVVTGAAGTLGSAVAEYFEDRGARVARLDIVKLTSGITCDLFDEASCSAAIATVVETFGTIDVLVNAAGGFAMGTQVHDTAPATWELMYKLNAGSVINMARCAVPVLLDRTADNGNGKIINVAARAGLAGAATMGAYVAAKSAVIKLTETMAEELKEQGVNVNCVLPSIIDTPVNREAMPNEDFSRWVAPVSIAKLIAFLASDAAADIHGAAVPIVGLS